MSNQKSVISEFSKVCLQEAGVGEHRNDRLGAHPWDARVFRDVRFDLTVALTMKKVKCVKNMSLPTGGRRW